jgi:tetratricopeptide (TPR) repeat protein
MAEHDITLTPEELADRQRKRRRLLIIALTVSLLLVVAFFAARPVRNAIRSWQARRHAQRAFVFIDQNKWREARDEATAAYRLRSNQPDALRAVARLLSRAGQADALEFWRNLDSVTPLTRTDLREEAGIALKVNDLPAAGEAVQRLLENRKERPTAADWLLAADVWGRKREYGKATRFAEKALAEPQPTRREQFQAILILETVMRTGGASLVPNPKPIDDRMTAFAMGNDDVALDALIALAQYALALPSGPANSLPMAIHELIQRIDNHPLAKAGHKLLAAELEISQQPDQRPEIEQRTIDRWKNGSNEELAALGTWLYSHGEYQRELEVIPLERATQTRELFLQHIDALGALKRWDDIRKILENERFPLDPVIQNMYLARCYAQQGQQQGADNNWQRAIENAAGDVPRLLMLGDYAEKNGAEKVAGTAYEAAAAISPKSRSAQLGRLRVAEASRDTKRIHVVLEELLKIWPNDTAIQNDEAYIRLLLLPPDTKPDAKELKSIETIAQKLVQEEPSSLPHRTLLGLVYLKENQPFVALNLYNGLNVPQKELTPSAVVVHSAVLAANGRDADARTEISHLPQSKLLPEERALIKQF